MTRTLEKTRRGGIAIPDELRQTWTWTNWKFSSVIAEALFASWASDTHGESTRWMGQRRPEDVSWDGAAVDVKDAFAEDALTPGLEKAPCIGFMGTDRGPGAEARESVTHYALVVRDVDDGGDTAIVERDGRIVVESHCRFAIYLVPRDEVNTFFARRTNAGVPTGKNRYQLASVLEEFKVFDNH